MIQPIKQFRVTRLTISGFKGYADQKTFQFGGMNVISGHMGVGKSSIADAIAFAITGVGFYAGAKIDYLYHQDTRDLLVELEFEDESGKLRTLARHRKDDKMDITLDGVRIGQGDLTTMFGERDLFLSMFNNTLSMFWAVRAATFWSGICRRCPRRKFSLSSATRRGHCWKSRSFYPRRLTPSSCANK